MKSNRWAIIKPAVYIGLICVLIILMGNTVLGFRIDIFFGATLYFLLSGLYLLVKGPGLKRIAGLTLILVPLSLPIFFGYHFSAHLDMPMLTINGRITGIDGKAVAQKEVIVELIRREIYVKDEVETVAGNSFNELAQFSTNTDDNGFFHLNIPPSTKRYGGYDMFNMQYERYRNDARASVIMQCQIGENSMEYYIETYRDNKWVVYTYSRATGRRKLDAEYPFQVTLSTLGISDHGDTLQLSIIYDESKIGKMDIK